MNGTISSSRNAAMNYGGSLEGGRGMAVQVAKDIMPYALSGVALLALTSCGGAATPAADYSFDIAICNTSGEVEIPAERSLRLTVPGKQAIVVQHLDGSVKIGEVTVTTNGGSTIGSEAENHMIVTGLGDLDQDGFQSVRVDSVCPAPPPPTLVPSTPGT